MIRYHFRSIGFQLGTVLCICSLSAAFPAASPAATDSIAELHDKAKKEGGKLTLYAPLSARAMEVIPQAFMKRFPGVTVDHIDATPDKLLARIVTEARGGRVLADVYGGSLAYVAQLGDQQLLVPLALPEAAAYSAQTKSDLWVATDTHIISRVGIPIGEERRGAKKLRGSYDPKWKDNMMGEPRDYQLLIGFAKRKYNSLEKAVDLFKKIAATRCNFIAAIRSSGIFGGRPARCLFQLLFAPFSAAHEKRRADSTTAQRGRG